MAGAGSNVRLATYARLSDGLALATFKSRAANAAKREAAAASGAAEDAAASAATPPSSAVPLPLLVDAAGDGGVQGLGKHDTMLQHDEEGDEAHEFIEIK